LLEEVAAWGRGCDCDAYWMFERDGVLVGAEEGINSGCGVEVCDFLFFEEVPDEGVIDLSEAEVGSADSSDCPAKCPSWIPLADVGQSQTKGKYL
jgi:hypothetical protein